MDEQAACMHEKCTCKNRLGRPQPFSETTTVRVAGIGDLTLRPVSTADARMIECLAHRVASNRPTEAPLLPERWIQSRDSADFLLHRTYGVFRNAPGVLGERALALASIRIPSDEPQSGLIHVLVDPPFRGLGIGRILVDRLDAFGRHRGLVCLKGRAHQSNVASLALAQRTGFRIKRLFGDEPMLLIRMLRNEGARNAVSPAGDAAEMLTLQAGRPQAGSARLVHS